jgi:DNA replication and repair protein RecF
MLLQKLSCQHFKNYETLALSFASQVNCIVGPNGAGKTNLLDAIHYLCLTKSAFNTVEGHNILHDQPQLALLGQFLKGDTPYKIQCTVHRQEGKLFYKNGKLYDKLRDHIGQFPIVLTTPYDAGLVEGPSELRRKFFDTLLCQLDGLYLQDLANYQHFLKQRNSLLKMYAGQSFIDQTLLAIYDEQLLALGKSLYNKRKDFMLLFLPQFQQHYQYFVTAPEVATITYVSALAQDNFAQCYRDHLQQDRLWQRTNLGAHRDEFVFQLNGHPLKKFGSQGQQKSFILALRLAQFTCLQHTLGCKPLLLLDDIFDKLDEQRMQRLIDLIAQQYFGQVLLTDASDSRSMHFFKTIQADKVLLKIEKGKVIESIA